jgi:hypothetical protein
MCSDCEALFVAALELDIEIADVCETVYECDDGEDRCLECALRYCWPEDYDGCVRNITLWGPSSSNGDDVADVQRMSGA